MALFNCSYCKQIRIFPFDISYIGPLDTVYVYVSPATYSKYTEGKKSKQVWEGIRIIAWFSPSASFRDSPVGSLGQPDPHRKFATTPPRRITESCKAKLGSIR